VPPARSNWAILTKHTIDLEIERMTTAIRELNRTLSPKRERALNPKGWTVPRVDDSETLQAYPHLYEVPL
jgi:hypothetical protein